MRSVSFALIIASFELGFALKMWFGKVFSAFDLTEQFPTDWTVFFRSFQSKRCVFLFVIKDNQFLEAVFLLSKIVLAAFLLSFGM